MNEDQEEQLALLTNRLAALTKALGVMNDQFNQQAAVTMREFKQLHDHLAYVRHMIESQRSHDHVKNKGYPDREPAPVHGDKKSAMKVFYDCQTVTDRLGLSFTTPGMSKS